jgi:hypothetical protein
VSWRPTRWGHRKTPDEEEKKVQASIPEEWGAAVWTSLSLEERFPLLLIYAIMREL